MAPLLANAKPNTIIIEAMQFITFVSFIGSGQLARATADAGEQHERKQPDGIGYW
jgi:hypothetical protein